MITFTHENLDPYLETIYRRAKNQDLSIWYRYLNLPVPAIGGDKNIPVNQQR
jgi:hypothetical protein